MILDGECSCVSKKKIIFSTFFVYFFALFLNILNQEVILRKHQARLEVDLQQVNREKESLNKSMKYYQTNAGVEEIARKRLGYYKQDEVPIRLLDVPEQATR